MGNIFQIAFSLIPVVIAVFFIRKMPAANWILMIAHNSMPTMQIVGPLNSNRIFYTIQIVNIVVLSLRCVFSGRHKKSIKSQSISKYIYSAGLILTWLLIIFTTLYQREHVQIQLLKSSIINVVIPLITLALCLILYSPGQVARAAIIGMCVWSTIALTNTIIYPREMIAHGSYNSISGLASGNVIDYITRGRVYFYGALGFLMLPGLFRYKMFVQIINYIVASIFILVLFYVGAKQYFLGIIFVLIIILIREPYSAKRKFVYVAITFMICFFFLIEFLSATTFVERARVALSGNLSEFVRVIVWKDVLADTANHPFAGVGFANFGGLFINYIPNFGINVSKMTPHGFFQTILVEHGIIVFLIIFTGFVINTKYIINEIKKNDNINSEVRLFSILMLSMIVPENVSGVVVNCLGYNLLGLLPLLVITGKKQKNMHIPTEVDFNRLV